MDGIKIRNTLKKSTTVLTNLGTVEPGYNDIGLLDISCIASDIVL
jgi:hypothetical protein